MNLNKLADRIRPKLPWFLWNAIRKPVNALLGPWNFSIGTGHFKSSFLSRAVDCRGHPLPWFPYPAIQFLLQQDFSEKAVMEWGAGQSTLFWAKRAKHVVSFESDPSWHAALQSMAPSNATIHLVKDDLSDWNASSFQDRKFDVIVVDGLDRWACARNSVGLLKEGGVIVVDNADGNHGPRAGWGIIDYYFELGLRRIDFIGFPPGISVPHCTSIFFKDDCFMLRNPKVPVSELSA